MENNGNTTTILLLGFPGPYTSRIFLFLLICLIYCGTICGNLLVIILVSCSRILHSPMYFFLTQLTISDIIVTSDIVPNMLHGILKSGSSLSLPGCITQLFFFSYSECAECLLLTAMSYDRYLAICKPLYYHSLMSPRFCLRSIIISWIISFFASITTTISASQLPFCRSNVIDHFYCDFDPLLELSCSDTFNLKLLALSLSLPMLVFPFVIIVISYTFIIHTILNIRSINQREKTFSTCGSHLTVVSIFYGTLSFVYLSPVKRRSNILHKILSLMYCVVTPSMNPIIYCLRNKDIKRAFGKLIELCPCSQNPIMKLDNP